MNQSKLIIALLAVSMGFTSCRKDNDTPSKGNTDNPNEQIVNIPDVNFKEVLIGNVQINTNGDDKITVAEAEAFTGTIKADKKEITNVEGLEAFINVTKIHLFKNGISSIDVSKNTKVTQLLIEHNLITSIDISNLHVLTDFKAGYNHLTFANIANGNNANMWRMNITNNPNLTCIKVDAVPTPSSGWEKDNTVNYSTSCME